MVIREFSALHFRNIAELRISFSEGINILLGSNGQGKTNIVEGVYFLNHLDSFRTHQMEPLIQHGAAAAQVQCVIATGESERKVRAELTRRGRKVWVDGELIPKLSEYVASFFALIFNPDFLYLFRHVPSERRWLINRVLSFIDPGYLAALRELRAIHAQKNSLLRQGDLSSLPAWNQLFAEKSYVIVTNRMAFAQRVSGPLGEAFGMLTGRAEPLRLEVHSGLKGSAADMLAALEKAQDQEARMGHALIGPHRDTVRLVLGEDKRDGLFSQGEYRAALLALQFALGALLESARSFRPVMILDDAFSELDEHVRKRLLEALPRLPNQVFITATEAIEPMHASGARIMEVHAGRVTAP